MRELPNKLNSLLKSIYCFIYPVSKINGLVLEKTDEEILLGHMKCIDGDINQVETDEPAIESFYGKSFTRLVAFGSFWDRFNAKMIMSFPNAVCALFDYLYLVIELES